MTWGFVLLAMIVVSLVAVAARLAHSRSRRRPPASRQGTVVRDILAGGFGQIRLEQPGQTLLLAARSAGGEFLPEGTAIEVVDDTRSVLLVQRLKEAG